MKREVKMIIAGGVAGLLSGSLGWLFGQINGRGMVLGIFLAAGVVYIEKKSAHNPEKSQYPEWSTLAKAILMTGALSGILGYYTILASAQSNDFGNMFSPYIFNYFQFILVITLYPLFILPAYFAKGKNVLTVFSGAFASLLIETIRGMVINKSSNIPDLFASASISALFMGFTFTLLWVICVGSMGKRSVLDSN